MFQPQALLCDPLKEAQVGVVGVANMCRPQGATLASAYATGAVQGAFTLAIESTSLAMALRLHDSDPTFPLSQAVIEMGPRIASPMGTWLPTPTSRNVQALVAHGSSAARTETGSAVTAHRYLKLKPPKVGEVDDDDALAPLDDDDAPPPPEPEPGSDAARARHLVSRSTNASALAAMTRVRSFSTWLCYAVAALTVLRPCLTQLPLKFFEDLSLFAGDPSLYDAVVAALHAAQAASAAKLDAILRRPGLRLSFWFLSRSSESNVFDSDKFWDAFERQIYEGALSVPKAFELCHMHHALAVISAIAEPRTKEKLAAAFPLGNASGVDMRFAYAHASANKASFLDRTFTLKDGPRRSFTGRQLAAEGAAALLNDNTLFIAVHAGQSRGVRQLRCCRHARFS